MDKIECIWMMDLSVSKLLWSPAVPSTANRQQGRKVATDAAGRCHSFLNISYLSVSCTVSDSFGFPDPERLFFFPSFFFLKKSNLVP